jgi:hypothetical protein
MPHDRDVARLAVGIAVQHTVLQLFVDLCRRELRILRDLHPMPHKRCYRRRRAKGASH